MRIALSCFVLFCFACAGSAKTLREPPKLTVDKASLPFHIVQAKTGREISPEDFFAELASKRAVCVGESHDDVHHHWAQLAVVEKLATDGGTFAVGMEMFQRPFQGVLDDFAQGKISEDLLLERSDWKRRWSYDWAYYAPSVRVSIAHGGALLALNISNELKEKWKLAKSTPLSAADQAKIPELNFGDDEHRRWFRSLMESMSSEMGHGSSAQGAQADHALSGEPEQAPSTAGPKPGPKPGPNSGPNAGPASGPTEPPATEPAPSEAQEELAPAEEDFIDQIYPVQVLWDETMADSAYRWLSASPDRHMVILAGHGHCHDSAIVRRMQRRGIAEVVSVRPVVETGNGEVADLLSAPENDYLFVMDKPTHK